MVQCMYEDESFQSIPFAYYMYQNNNMMLYQKSDDGEQIVGIL
jgi:hypothetical protein